MRGVPINATACHTAAAASNKLARASQSRGSRCGSQTHGEACLDVVTEKDVRKALRKVKDPELNLDIVVLGLVYDLDIADTHVNARISLTSPFCPAANQIIDDTKAAIEGVEGIETANVELTFDPPWTPERIDPLIRATLGI